MGRYLAQQAALDEIYRVPFVVAELPLHSRSAAPSQLLA